jgi:hypothetical protein
MISIYVLVYNRSDEPYQDDEYESFDFEGPHDSFATFTIPKGAGSDVIGSISTNDNQLFEVRNCGGDVHAFIEINATDLVFSKDVTFSFDGLDRQISINEWV